MVGWFSIRSVPSESRAKLCSILPMLLLSAQRIAAGLCVRTIGIGGDNPVRIMRSISSIYWFLLRSLLSEAQLPLRYIEPPDGIFAILEAAAYLHNL